MQKISVDPFNYESALFLNQKLVYNKLDNFLFKETYIYLMSVEVHSDYGWIFSDISVKSEIDLSYIELDASTQDRTSNYLDSTVIYYLKDKTIYRRTYSKIQKLVAEIGGILKFVSTAGSLIIGFLKTISLEFELVTAMII